MMIQVIGTKGGAATRKARRFFQERGVAHAFVDLEERGLTKGELENIARRVSLSELLDRSGKQFARRGLEHMEFALFEELLADPLLLKAPIVRSDREVAVGEAPEAWKRMAAEARERIGG